MGIKNGKKVKLKKVYYQKLLNNTLGDLYQISRVLYNIVEDIFSKDLNMNYEETDTYLLCKFPNNKEVLFEVRGRKLLCNFNNLIIPVTRIETLNDIKEQVMRPQGDID